MALLTFCNFSHAEVLDVDAGEHSAFSNTNLRVVGSVLDLERPPKEQPVAPDNQGSRSRTSKSTATVSVSDTRRGPVEIEELITEVALHYATHPGIRGSGLTLTEWIALFRANIAIESNFKQSARSHVGAIGLGQLMPDTAQTLGVNPFDARDNLHGSARYLLTQLQDFGSKELALAAYNAGPAAVSRYGGVPPYRETQGHVRKVLEIYNSTL